MDRVEEIEAAINDLPPEDFRRIANWVRERDQSLWDQQLDSSSGKLDFLLKKSKRTLSRALFAMARAALRSVATRRFWNLFYALPTNVQQLAVKNYRLWQQNPNHPSLHFRRR